MGWLSTGVRPSLTNPGSEWTAWHGLVALLSALVLATCGGEHETGLDQRLIEAALGNGGPAQGPFDSRWDQKRPTRS
jgi:hypothetical protein